MLGPKYTGYGVYKIMNIRRAFYNLFIILQIHYLVFHLKLIQASLISFES